MAPPKIKLCNLYPSTDARGRPFLKGRLGDTRVIVAERTDVTHEGGAATHELFLVERNFRMDARRLDEAHHGDEAAETILEGRSQNAAAKST